jgi:hypothetical protein
MSLKSIFDAALSSASAARSIPGLNYIAAVGAIWRLTEIERRINRVFESYKDDLAAKLLDRLIPWLQNDIGTFKRFLMLQRGYGLLRTVRMVRQNVVADQCKNYSGADGRVSLRGSSARRNPNASNPSAKRRTDPPEYYALLCSRISKAACN